MHKFIRTYMYIYIYIMLSLLLWHLTSLFGFWLRSTGCWSKNRSRFYPRNVNLLLPVAHKLKKIWWFSMTSRTACEILAHCSRAFYKAMDIHLPWKKVQSERRPSDLVQPDAKTFNHSIQHLSSLWCHGDILINHILKSYTVYINNVS